MRMKRYLEFINQHLTIIGIAGAGFWTFVVALWYAFAVPVIDSHIDSRVIKMANDSLGTMIDSRVIKMANDSLGTMIDSHMSSKGGGFRGGLSDKTGINKESIVDSLAVQMLSEGKLRAEVKRLQDELDYQKGYNFWVLKQVAEKRSYNDVTFWLPPDGNTYYLDIYNYLWDAKYDAYDDCYYFYPSYGNGNRLKCEQ